MRIMANFKNPAVVEQCAMRLLPFAEQWRQPGDLVCADADFMALLQGLGAYALNEESALSLLYFLALTANDSASRAKRCKALLLARLDAVGDDSPDMCSAFQSDHLERLNAGPAQFQPAGLRLLREIVPEEEEPEPDGFAPFEPFDEGQADDLPGFPVEALPPVMGDYAQAIATSLQVPADMPAVGLLAAVSLAVQGVYKVNPKPGWLEPLNLYIAVVAKPSERKSPVLAEISRQGNDAILEGYPVRTDVMSLDEAKQSLSALDGREYFTLIAEMLKKYAQPGEGEICFNERDLNRLPEGFEETISEIAGAKGGSLTLSRTPCGIGGGFILVYGGIEENCSFDSVFADEKERLQDRIHEMLFA